MRIFDTRPRLRWAVPAVAAAALVGGTLAATTAGGLRAQADAGLPDRSAQQLLTDVASAQVPGLAGTVSQHADLGLPDLSGLTGSSASGPSSAHGHGGAADSGPLAWASGSHTMRVWYGGPAKQRVAVLDTLGETDVVRNGRNVWTWSSDQNTAHHQILPRRTSKNSADDHASGTPLTPQAAAKKLLAAVDPSTIVRTSGTDTVAGRAAYDLVLRPRAASSLIGQVRLAIDGKTHVPLRVQVFAKGADTAAVDIGYTSVSFGAQPASRFTFTPPDGATVVEPKPASPTDKAAAKQAAKKADAATTWVGSGWSSVLVTDLAELRDASAHSDGLRTLTRSLPQVSGAWGSGHLLHSSLVNVVFTNDGRVAAGAVTPQTLYAALAG